MSDTQWDVTCKNCQFLLIETSLNITKNNEYHTHLFWMKHGWDGRDFQIHLEVKGMMMLMQIGFMLPRIKSRGGLLWMCHWSH